MTLHSQRKLKLVNSDNQILYFTLTLNSLKISWRSRANCSCFVENKIQQQHNIYLFLSIPVVDVLVVDVVDDSTKNL